MLDPKFGEIFSTQTKMMIQIMQFYAVVIGVEKKIFKFL